MVGGLEPTEETDGSVIVRLLDDGDETRTIRCDSYADAIEVVTDRQRSVTAAKILDRDENVVFTSAEMEIEVWEAAWEDAKRELSVDVDESDCPYENGACFPGDRCVRCQLSDTRGGE
ncbi:hypothetical protein QA600_13035 [Natronococcus sp. A-GB1]|uniref:hypothetical protein n=1 Tax=Natronococcus sp. A-GB1 TaxID=3037648 RepID=UPI00241CCF15|nr:hypothetical protein [Natronococcus sp. A-GB1]MDG5760262.1 hypothetical protein [Natronococcus sp. A-GB1]